MTKTQQNSTKLKYAIYTRVSTNEQENENQLIQRRLRGKLFVLFTPHLRFYIPS